MRVGTRLSVAAFALLLVSCNRRPPAAVPVVLQPSPAALVMEDATQQFAMANYTAASRGFERYLQLVPSGGDVDHALFHLGLIYSLPEPGWQDWTRANGYLRRLIREFPQSSYRPATNLILSLRDQAAQLSAEISKLTSETTQLRAEATALKNETDNLKNDATQLRTTSAQLTEQLAKLKAESDATTAELEKKEQRIRQLNTELERLIRIDSERRPSRN